MKIGDSVTLVDGDQRDNVRIISTKEECGETWYRVHFIDDAEIYCEAHELKVPEPPASQRAEVIAERIEQNNSSHVYIKSTQSDLFVA